MRTLNNGKVSAEILEKGAELKSLKVGGKELMWCADPKYWGKTSPVLFPSVGTVREETAIFGGKAYPMPKHGFARDTLFQTREISENSVVLGFSESALTLSMFPFRFDFSIKYELTECGILITYTVKNNSDIKMPYCIGAHPALSSEVSGCKLVFREEKDFSACPMNTSTRLFESRNRRELSPRGRVFQLGFPMFDNDCLYFDRLIPDYVELVGEGTSIVAISSEGFKTLSLWTPAEKCAPFICIEPWCGSDSFDDESGEFSEKRNTESLSPQEERQYRLKIELI